MCRYHLWKWLRHIHILDRGGQYHRRYHRPQAGSGGLPGERERNSSLSASLIRLRRKQNFPGLDWPRLIFCSRLVSFSAIACCKLIGCTHKAPRRATGCASPAGCWLARSRRLQVTRITTWLAALKSLGSWGLGVTVNSRSLPMLSVLPNFSTKERNYILYNETVSNPNFIWRFAGTLGEDLYFLTFWSNSLEVQWRERRRIVAWPEYIDNKKVTTDFLWLHLWARQWQG